VPWEDGGVGHVVRVVLLAGEESGALPVVDFGTAGRERGGGGAGVWDGMTLVICEFPHLRPYLFLV
jgi:hypothetical protein